MGWSEQRIACSKLKCMLLVRIIWEVNIGVVRAKDHLFQAEVHVTSEDHLGGKYCIGVVRAKDHLFQAEVHVTSEDHLGGKYWGGQSKGSPVPN